MARKTILVSDLTGKEIEDRNAARITINFSDARKGTIILDVNETEISDLVSKGDTPGSARPQTEELAARRTTSGGAG
jgi:hypothetical protein